VIKEAIDRVIELARGMETSPVLTQTVDHRGADGQQRSFVYETKMSSTGARLLGDAVKPFRPAKIQVTTLAGFLDAIKAGAAGDITTGLMVHVEDYLTVSVVGVRTDEFGVRDTLITAKHPPIDAFNFDQYYSDPQKFIIGLQVAFLMTEPLMGLIGMVSKLKTGSTVETNDDGYSQTVTVKQGEIGTADVKIPPRIKLVPIRSFSEINAVQSEFLLRFNQGTAGQAQPALFNVDGTKWKDETMLSIKHYLAKQDVLKRVTIVS
jgi:hypothetical protein